MEVHTKPAGDAIEVTIEGRMDGHWADHLTQALNQIIRQGSHRIRLNLSQVPYISSAGIGVVVYFYKQLQEIHGSLVVSDVSPFVRKVLEVAKLGPLLLADAAPASAVRFGRRLVGFEDPESPNYEVHELDAGARMTCRVLGDASLLRGCRFREEHARRLRFPASTMALGLGAFGAGFADCRGRFGDFLAVAGAAAYQPSDGSHVPDYLLSPGDLEPELMVLYGLACEGAFSHLVRFEPKTATRTVALSELAAACLDMAEADSLAIVMVNDSAGLIGASLRQSPAGAASDGAPFRYPEVRRWLSFTAERAFPHALTLVVGVAARGDAGALQDMLRPLGKKTSPRGHFHAAAFSYRPLKKGSVELKATVSTLFEAATLQGVLHLLADDREIEGAGESEFARGACWLAPIAEIRTE